MKYTMFLIAFIGTMLFNGHFIFSDDWKSNAFAIQDTLASLTKTLLEDAQAFDQVSLEIANLASIVQTNDLTEQDAIKSLGLQFGNFIQEYKNVLNEQQLVQVQNAANVQQLKVILATLQSSIQNKLDQLNIENSVAQDTLNQLTKEYNVAVADNQQEATDLLTILRSVCENYQTMVDKKQLSVDGINELLTALNDHIQNATASFEQLNTLINQ